MKVFQPAVPTEVPTDQGPLSGRFPFPTEYLPQAVPEPKTYDVPSGEALSVAVDRWVGEWRLAWGASLE